PLLFTFLSFSITFIYYLYCISHCNFPILFLTLIFCHLLALSLTISSPPLSSPSLLSLPPSQLQGRRMFLLIPPLPLPPPYEPSLLYFLTHAVLLNLQSRT